MTSPGPTSVRPKWAKNSVLQGFTLKTEAGVYCAVPAKSNPSKWQLVFVRNSGGQVDLGVHDTAVLACAAARYIEEA